MTKVFISYSRKDKATAAKLTEALQRSELETWIDWEDIPPTSNWMDQIHHGIESADGFLFLISPDSVASKVCTQEINHAVQNGKRLLPIVVREFNAADIHPALAKVNWIYCTESDDFEKAVEKTIESIRTDLAWVEAHRRLQIRALEWERNKNRSLLLRGDDLRTAEESLAASHEKDPQPTDLQRQFLLESRRSATQTRNLIGLIAIGVAIALAIATFAAILQGSKATQSAATAMAESNLRGTAQVEAQKQAAAAQTAQVEAQYQEGVAKDQAYLATTREVAALALIKLEDPKSPELAYLLAAQGYHRADIQQIRSSLLSVVHESPPFLDGFLNLPDGTPLLPVEYTNSMITSFAINQDSTILAAGRQDGNIVLWNIPSRQAIRILFGNGIANSVAFSPDGNTLAAGSRDGKIRLWDVTTGVQIGEPLVGHTNIIWGVAFSHQCPSPSNGCVQMLASAGSDKTIILWDVSNLKNITPIGTPLTGHTDSIYSVAFSPDGKTLASGSIDKTIRLWDLKTHTQVGYPLTGHTGGVTTVTFNPSCQGQSNDCIQMLASGGFDRTVRLWNVSNVNAPTRIGQMTGHTRGINSSAFSPDGKILASGSEDTTVRIWNVETRKQIGDPLIGHDGVVTSVIFNRDGILISGSRDNTIRLWNLTDRAQVQQSITGSSDMITSIAFNPDGQILGSGNCKRYNSDGDCIAGEIFFWNVNTHAKIGDTLTGQAGEITSVAFSPDGKILASGSCGNPDKWGICQTGEIILWDVDTHTQIGQPLTGHTNGVNSLAFSKDGILASGSSDRTVRLWNLSTGESITLTGHTEEVMSVAFSPDGKSLASGSCAVLDSVGVCHEGEIFIWNVADHKQIASITGHTAYVSSVAFNKDGLLASGGYDYTVSLWKNVDGVWKQIGPLTGHTGPVREVAFSPDGKTLASGSAGVYASSDGEILLWDVDTGSEIGFLYKQGSGTFSVAFSPNGTLATGSVDSIIRLWDVSPGTWYNIACQIASRNFTQAEWNEYFPGEIYQVTCPQWPAGK